MGTRLLRPRSYGPSSRRIERERDRRHGQREERFRRRVVGERAQGIHPLRELGGCGQRELAAYSQHRSRGRRVERESRAEHAYPYTVHRGPGPAFWLLRGFFIFAFWGAGLFLRFCLLRLGTVLRQNLGSQRAREGLRYEHTRYRDEHMYGLSSVAPHRTRRLWPDPRDKHTQHELSHRDLSSYNTVTHHHAKSAAHAR